MTITREVEVHRKESLEPVIEKAPQQDIVQPKTALSNWNVDAGGSLNHAPVAVIQKAPEEKEIKKKEDEHKEEDKSSPGPQLTIGKKTANELNSNSETIPDAKSLSSATHSVQTKAVLQIIKPNNITVASKPESDTVQDRGPPIQRMGVNSKGLVIQRSLFDSALSHIGEFLSDIPITLSLDVAKRWLMNGVRRFASYIPGYRALGVVLGHDPITGDEIAQNGRNFIEAALDIIPGGNLIKQKLDELGLIDRAATWIDTQIAALAGIVQNVRNEFMEAWNALGISSILDGPMNILRNFGGILERAITNIINFARRAATELIDIVKKFLLTQIVAFIKQHTNAYELLKVIIGKDPITDEPVQRNGTNILNALLEMGGDAGREQRRQMLESHTFEKAAAWIDRGIAVFGDLYDAIRSGFSRIWNIVSIQALMHPIDTFNQIYATFAGPVSRVLAFVTDTLRVILGFIKEALMTRLSAWARTIRGYPLVTVIIGKDPFTNATIPRTVENIIRGFMSLMEGGEEQFNQLQQSGAIGRAAQRINAAVARLNMTPEYVIQLFIQVWNAFSFADLTNPIAAFQRILARFGEPIGRLISFVVEIVKIVVEVVMQVMNFPSDLIANIIARAMQAFEMIKRDPVAFLKNLLRAIKQGFIQFFGNIGRHLLAGLQGWLMSELRDSGVQAPTDFTLRGIIGWVLQLLGITMDKIWKKLAQHPRIGPQRVARIRGMINQLEGIWTFIKDVQQRGMAAIWDKIQERLSSLWDTILDAVKNWIMEQIVDRVTARLLSMLDPTGIMAVINGALALYRAVQSFMRYLRQMLEIVNSFVEGVVQIASGNITVAANFLERSMARGVPIMIGFLANQVGLSGLGRRIGEMVGRVRALVDQALTWLVNKAVDMGMNLLDRVMGRGGDRAQTGGQSLEDRYGPEKAGRIGAGLQAIEAAEQPLLHSGKISDQEAAQVATTVKAAHPVFTSLEVVDGGDKWNYRYTASQATVVAGKPKNTGLPVNINVGDSILDKNSNIGYRVKEINYTTSLGLALKVENSSLLFLYTQYGTRWEKPAGKPAFVGFSSGGGPTVNRTARITIDKAHLPTGSTSPNIPISVRTSIGYDPSGHWSAAGHLVAYSLGGPNGYTSGNIVPMTFNANHTSAGMRGIEDAVLRDIKATDAVYDYSVGVRYDSTIQFPPIDIVVTANKLWPLPPTPTPAASMSPKIVVNT